MTREIFIEIHGSVETDAAGKRLPDAYTSITSRFSGEPWELYEMLLGAMKVCPAFYTVVKAAARAVDDPGLFQVDFLGTIQT